MRLSAALKIRIKVNVSFDLASEREQISTIDQQRVLSSLHDSPALLVKVLFKVLNVTF